MMSIIIVADKAILNLAAFSSVHNLSTVQRKQVCDL